MNQTSAIDAMLAEIESGMIVTGVDFDNPVHQAYIDAKMELASPDPNFDVVNYILTLALDKPSATRH